MDTITISIKELETQLENAYCVGRDRGTPNGDTAFARRCVKHLLIEQIEELFPEEE